MKIDNSTVEKIAHLARLEFNESEKENMLNDMNNMLTFVEKLNKLETSHLEPLIYMNEEFDNLRIDEVMQEITHGEALKNAPQKDSDYFKVPKVIDKK
jgi:aspartyl-tRNA(Asn)/glutamyl-tRNA(Gln) amidotransferase subunit C